MDGIATGMLKSGAEQLRWMRGVLRERMVIATMVLACLAPPVTIGDIEREAKAAVAVERAFVALNADTDVEEDDGDHDGMYGRLPGETGPEAVARLASILERKIAGYRAALDGKRRMGETTALGSVGRDAQQMGHSGQSGPDSA